MANIINNIPLKTQHLHLVIDINVPETTTVDINQESIQEAIRRLFQNNLQALVGDSPEEILFRLGFLTPNESNKSSLQKGKWAKIVARLEENAMGKEAEKAFNKGRKEFRETFAIGDTFNDR
jgi:hypothetical protein